MASGCAITAPRVSRVLSPGAILRTAVSFPVLLGGLLIAGGFVGARLNLLDPDTWWHLKVGEQILRSGSWPRLDPYSFTVSGTHWIAYEWLGEVLMALAARLGGMQAATALLVGLSGTLLALLYYYALLRSRSSKAAFIACALILPTAAPFFTLRPQLMGYILLLLTLICLEHFRGGRTHALYALPVLFLIWVNTHGTFAFGLLVLGLYWAAGQFEFQKGGVVAQRWTPLQSRQLLVALLLCVAILPLTPYGTRLAAYPLEMALSQPLNVANIQEWQPLGFSLILGKYFLVLVLLFFLSYTVLRPAIRLEEMALLLFAAYAACVHLRFVIIFLLIFTPLLAVMLARWVPAYDAKKDRFALNAVLLGLIACGLVVFFPSRRELEGLAAQRYPRDAVEYLRQHPVSGPLFNEYGWGGYLIWAVGPQHRVFIDGRADIYEYAGVLADYLSISRLEPNALPLLQTYGIEGCLVARQAPLSTLLAALPDWERIYLDDVSVLYVHKRGHQSSASHLQTPWPRLGSSSLASGLENKRDQVAQSQVQNR